MGFLSGGNRVREVKYLFIDGAYLEERAKAFCERWFGKQVELDYASVGFDFDKVFYYDCLPAKADKETDEEYEKRLAEKEAFFDHLREIKGWHVIEGVSKRRKKGPASQKEVDILIAVDMLTHTYRKNMDQLAFIAGDQDFRPLVDAVVKDGMYVELWYDPRSISKDLRDTADARTPLTYFKFLSWLEQAFRTSHPGPYISNTVDAQTPPNTILQERGYVGGEEFATLWRSVDGDTHYIATSEKVGGWYLNWHMLGDVDLLKRIFDEYVRQIEWRPARATWT